MKRTEILPGVFLNHIYSDKFKTAVMSVTMLTQLSRETASLNALIPFVLRRGTSSCGDMAKISNRLDDLYGTVIEPSVRRFGEIQGVGLSASFPESRYLPVGENILRDVISFMSEMLLSPATRGGLLLPQYVESEKQNLINMINSLVNDKRTYAAKRCVEEMCCYEDYAVGKYGSAEDCENIGYRKLTKQYRNLLQTCPVEIIYCGQSSEEDVLSCLSDCLSTMPRGVLSDDIGTDIRMNSVEESARFITEEMDVAQGKLVIGYRLGEVMNCPDIPAIAVFNAVFGSGVTSKLFANVREKLSLCYYAFSSVDRLKGVMFVNSGIETCNFEAAKAEIELQLNAVRDGEVTDEELTAAKQGLISECASLLDSPADLESFYMTGIVSGEIVTPQERAEAISYVTKEDVTGVAKSVVCDMVYFLKGTEENGNDED